MAARASQEFDNSETGQFEQSAEVKKLKHLIRLELTKSLFYEILNNRLMGARMVHLSVLAKTLLRSRRHRW